jgi:hypothetical protein
MNYADINASAVIAGCDGYFAARNNRIQKDREEMIQKLMGGFFNRTREQAIAKLQRPDGMFPSEWDKPEWRGSSTCSEVEELYALAKVAEKYNSTVKLDSEMAFILGKYL